MSHYANIASRILNTPLLIHPQKAQTIISVLGEELGLVPRASKKNKMKNSFTRRNSDDDYGYDAVEGMAIIPIGGTLVHKNGGLVQPYSGVTGYDGIRKNFLHALANPAVRGIVFDIDSPGGEVAGCFDLVDMIYDSRGEKPIASILSECAFSAAYAIASATDIIYVPRTGGVGSVGVVCMHVDFSQAMEDAGLKVTFIQYGDRKTDGTEMRPLEGDALKRIQDDVDRMGELFVKTVARNRNISAKKVREMQAATFSGEQGIANSLADIVASPDAAFEELVNSLK